MTLNEYIVEHFYGRLEAGKHQPDGKACILEAVSAWKNMSWTDNPEVLNTWDLRPLNDIAVPSDLRTHWMPQVYAAYADCRNWPVDRKQTVVISLILALVREIIAEMPGLHEPIRNQCRQVHTLSEAARAAEKAAAVAAAAAAAAAEAEAAEIFIKVCKLWIQAATS